MDKWDRRFLNMAIEAASWSKDPNTQVGAVIFRDRHPLVSGFNGFPAGIEDAPYRLNDRDVKRKLTVHAELNAILIAARRGIAVEGSDIIVTGHPCVGCMGPIIQAGIRRVICPLPWVDEDDTYGFAYARSMAVESGITLEYFDPNVIPVPGRGE